MTLSPSLTEHVPAELREPFYIDQYEQEHMKPPLIRLLLSSDIYCRAWRQALPPGPDGASAPKDNAALLQFLARRGLVPTFQDKPIKEADLHHKPIRLVSLQAVLKVLSRSDVRNGGSCGRIRVCAVFGIVGEGGLEA